MPDYLEQALQDWKEKYDCWENQIAGDPYPEDILALDRASESLAKEIARYNACAKCGTDHRKQSFLDCPTWTPST